MASVAVDNAKAFAEEQLATLRVKLNQIPALQEVEVRNCFPVLDLGVKQHTVRSVSSILRQSRKEKMDRFDLNRRAKKNGRRGYDAAFLHIFVVTNDCLVINFIS